MGRTGFRFKRAIKVPYARQGYIYFKSLRYQNLPAREQERIRHLCDKVAGYNGQALLEHVTTGEAVKSVCQRHYIASLTTLYRALKRYYEWFPEDM